MSDAAVLPDEIVADVLSRLPVKSLCRFKCVSHSWHSLISDPHFAQTHLTHNNNNMPERLILISYSYALYSVDCSTDVPVATKLDFPSAKMESYVLLGSCNGLLLFLNVADNSNYLLNLSTRESKKLPKSPFALDSLEAYNLYGLGFDSSTDEYKVVLLSCHRGNRYEESEGTNTDTNTIVSVYSLKANSWTSIQGGSSYGNRSSSMGVYVNGVLHWLDFRRSDYFCMIVTFDLANESFREWPLPTPVEYLVSWCSLAVLGGCLCLLDVRFTQTDGHTQTDVWMMKEYGVRESWTKITIYKPNMSTMELVCSLEDGEFLLAMDKEKLVVDNPKEGTKRDMVVCGIPTWFECWGTYVESLVSPNGIVRRFEAQVKNNGEDSSSNG